MLERTSDTETDDQALERFVVENDDLLELEERIGRFNVFDALGVARAEIRHSNFLSWLLDPAESHGHGDLFLKALVTDLLKKARQAGLGVPIRAVDLDGAEFRGVEVHRERWNIDLLIVSREPALLIAIENKVDSDEHSGQLQRYEETVAREFPGIAGNGPSRAVFVYLTPDGREPSDDDWLPYSYGDVHRVISRVRRTAGGSLGGDVGVFLDHYLNLIGSRMMDDARIGDLCRKIYTNHRRAIDLIVERVGPGDSDVARAVEAMLRERPRQWIVCGANRRMIFFVPASWVGPLVNPDGTTTSHAPADFYLEFHARDTRLHLRVVVGPAKDTALRRRLIERLTIPKNEFEFSTKLKNLTDTYTRVFARAILSWDEDAEPAAEVVIAAATKALAELEPRLLQVPGAVKEILG